MKFKQIAKTALNVLLGLIVVIEILIVGLVIYSRATGGVPNLFGYSFYVIISPSMEPEICVDDVILSKKYEGEQLFVGQVITFVGKEGEIKGKTVTHEIVNVDNTPDGQIITTKGLANDSPDAPITEQDVLSVMLYKTVVITFIYGIVSSPVGFVLLIMLPLVAIIVLEIIKMTKTLKNPEEDTNSNE